MDFCGREGQHRLHLWFVVDVNVPSRFRDDALFFGLYHELRFVSFR
jgi:hypothetical protein